MKSFSDEKRFEFAEDEIQKQDIALVVLYFLLREACVVYPLASSVTIPPILYCFDLSYFHRRHEETLSHTCLPCGISMLGEAST
jgi:hypothetical protein